ncbi:MAG TPA: TonB-dependent receptor [Cyclobacteriaceae bacterium]
MLKQIILFILISVVIHTAAQGQASLLDKLIKLDAIKGTAGDALNELSRKGNFTFSYGNQIEINKKTELRQGEESVYQWLEKIFGANRMEYFVNGNKIILGIKNKSKSKTSSITIHGHVTDSLSGETLIGASVFIKSLAIGISTNSYGFYSLSIPEGFHEISVSFVGYHTTTRKINLVKEEVMDIQLSPSSVELKEVSVTAEPFEADLISPSLGMHKLSTDVIRKIPALAGEVDVFRALQLLPGVKTSSEASSGLSVRGGGLDQNLILLDEAPVYNPSHAIGVFSVFNTDAIKDVQLYKGVIPAEYGGRLSSIVDIKMKDGNTKKILVTGGVGTISSRLTIEGPIKKEKSSFLVSGRYTYSDAITQTLPVMRRNNFRFYFYDLNFKASHRFNSKNKLFLSAYAGQDVNRLGVLSDIKWNNATATIRWNHVFNERLFSNTTVLFSKYDYTIRAGRINPFSWNSSIEDVTMKNDFQWFANQSSMIRFGFVTTHHQINPGKATGTASTNVFGLPVSNTQESSIYASNEHQLSSKWVAQYGLRFTLFQNLGKSQEYVYNNDHEVTDTVYHNGGIYHTYSGLEPRVSFRYTLNESSSLKAGYSRTFQYLQLLSNSSFGLSPFDTWYPSNLNLKPQKADQVSLGYFKNYPQRGLEASAEVYYKWLYNQVDFANHAQLLFNPDLHSELRTGTGHAYGAEFFLKKNSGRLTGWMSYNYARAKKIIPEISARSFNANYDQPHAITIVANYNFGPRISLSGNWIYATGRPTTLPIESFGFKNYNVPIYAERNSIRLPDYHRLDIALTIESKEKPGKRFSHEWVFAVYNVYARKNPLMVFVSPPFSDFKSTRGVDAYSITVLPFIPSVSYNFKF